MSKQNEGRAIAFAHYKNGKLLGYRADTFGTIADKPKIYTYSRYQVEACLGWINAAMKKGGTGIGELLLERTGNPIAKELMEAEEKIHKDLQDAQTFEVRVVACPDYPREFNVQTAEYERVWDYPIEEINKWIEHPEDHEVIETHIFSLEGQLNMQ